MADTDTKQALILRDFKDAGTERSFTADDTVQLDAGTFANYVAAGLVADPKDKGAKAAAAPAS